MLTTEEILRRLDTQHAEIVTHHAKLTDANTQNTTALQQLTSRLSELEQTVVARRGGGGADSVETWGRKVIDSDALKTFRTMMGARGTVKVPVQQHSITTIGASAGALITPDRREAVSLPRQRLTVRGLLAQGQTSSNMVEFGRQTGRTNNAAPVSEGAPKPESTYAWTLEEAPVRTVAHFIRASRQAVDDAPMLQSLIDSELRYGLALVEEEQLLFGSGASPNLYGLAPQATTYNPDFLGTIEARTRYDDILAGIAHAQDSKIPATGVIINDVDWKAMQAIKDADGRYLGAGPHGAQAGTIWQLPVVDTPSMPAGEFMVGGFNIAAQIFDRLEAEVLVSSEDADNFTKNMVTVRAEERLALAVKIPEAIVYGSYQVLT